MKLASTIEFKSEPEFFNKEKSGCKNNTVRIVNEEKKLKAMEDYDKAEYERLKRNMVIKNE